MSEISDRLARARQRHQDAKRARREGRVDDARQATHDALTLRIEADDLDPTHADQAWVEDQHLHFDHASVLLFYREELAKDLDTQRARAKERLKHASHVLRDTKLAVEAFQAGKAPSVQ